MQNKHCLKCGKNIRETREPTKTGYIITLHCDKCKVVVGRYLELDEKEEL